MNYLVLLQHQQQPQTCDNMTSDDSKQKFIKKDYRVWNALGQEALGKNSNDSMYQQEESSTPIQSIDNLARHAVKQDNVNDKCNQNAEVDYKKNIATNSNQRDDDIENNKDSVSAYIVTSESTHQPSKKELIVSINKLTGLQEKLFYLVLVCCKHDNDLQTINLKTTDVAELIQCDRLTAKNVIARITDKRLIQRLKGKTSQTGFVRFAVTREIKRVGTAIAKNKKDTDYEFKKFLAAIKQKIISINKKEIKN